MKKIILSIALVTGLIGCNDYLDVNDDPNTAPKVDNRLLIPAAQGHIAAVIGGDMFNTAAFLAQYLDQAPEANQYNELSTYRFTPDLFNRSYQNLYAGALMDLENVRIQATAKNAWNEYYVATVLRAYTFQIIVDYIGNAPYSECFQGLGNTMPKWDNGKDIYTGILKELDDAEEKIDNSLIISGDVLLEKKIANWVKLANAVRLKIYMRGSNAKDQDNSAKIIELVEENNFFEDDIKFNLFTNEESKRNPWYQTNFISLSAINHMGSYPIVTYLRETEDPRLATSFNAAGVGGYIGMIPGSKTRLPKNKNKNYSTPVSYPVMPVFLYTQSELQFFIAEAYLRFFNDDAKAKEAYEAAITANSKTRDSFAESFDVDEVYGAGKFGEWKSSATLEKKLELIGVQKWVALSMINNTEAWSEIRRMGYPKFSDQTAGAINGDSKLYKLGELIYPWTNGLGNETAVKSIYYPQAAVNTNINTPTQRKLTDKVWWEK